MEICGTRFDGTDVECYGYKANKDEKLLDRYEVFELPIGNGGYGFVKRAKRKSDGQDVVVKFVALAKINKKNLVYEKNEPLTKEISFLNILHHPNIVDLLDWSIESGWVMMVMKSKPDSVDLFTFIEYCLVPIEDLFSYIFRQIVSAVEYLHDRGIVHRDVKDENVIIDRTFHATLIDFGSASVLTSEGFSDFYGTEIYCSPEVLAGKQYKGPEQDIWGLGLVLYMLNTSVNPFENKNEILECQPVWYPNLSRGLIELVTRMLDKNPETRATVKEVAENPWLSQPCDVESYHWNKVCPGCTAGHVDLDDNSAKRVLILDFIEFARLKNTPGLKESIDEILDLKRDREIRLEKNGASKRRFSSVIV